MIAEIHDGGAWQKDSKLCQKNYLIMAPQRECVWSIKSILYFNFNKAIHHYNNMWRKQKSLGLHIHFVVWKHWSKNRKMDCKRGRGSSSETGISIRIVNKSVIESNRSRKKRKFIKASMEKHKWVPREAQRDLSLPILLLVLFFFSFIPRKDPPNLPLTITEQWN